MAYFVGSANSLHDLRSVLVSALIHTGWSQSGDVVHKNSLAVTLTIAGDGLSIGSTLGLVVGNGVSAGVLIAPSGAPLRIGPLSIGRGAVESSWEWPVAYHLHILHNPEEVYLLVNYGGFWQILSFGASPAPGNIGTGNWGHTSIPAFGSINTSSSSQIFENSAWIQPQGAALNYYYSLWLNSTAPFFVDTPNGGQTEEMSSVIHGVEDSNGGVVWSARREAVVGGSAGSSNRGVSSATPLMPLLNTQPNSWNLEATLLPCQVFQKRAESKLSLIAELQHIRFTRNDYLPDGSILTLGADSWKIYPMYRREPSQRNPARTTNHSGTLAIAIRYDGP